MTDPMQTEPTHIENLIARYLYGEATPEEIRELEAWALASEENARQFKAYHRTWKAMPTPSFDADSEWISLKERISGKEQPQAEILPPVRKISLFPRLMRVAAIMAVLLVPAFLLWHYLSSPVQEMVSTGHGTTELALSDGTKVTLNDGATLAYPEKFVGNLRTVRLTGEAWFEVAHDRSKPFIVEAGDVRMKVVGTAFLVNTQNERGTREVVLSEGALKVYYEDRPATAVMLLPGDRAETDRDGKAIALSVNGDPNFLAWKTRRIVFTNTPLNEAVALVTKVYRVPVRLAGPGLSNCRITATFDRQPLESLLNVLTATLDLQVRRDGAGYSVTGSPCGDGR